MQKTPVTGAIDGNHCQSLQAAVMPWLTYSALSEVEEMLLSATETGRQEVQELAGLMTTAANKNPEYDSYPYTRHDREIRPQSCRPRSVGPAPLSGCGSVAGHRGGRR